MSCWRILIALLMLSQIVMAEEELTAEQVVQRWVKEQREHPVSQVKFSWITLDSIFLVQENRYCEVTYTSETSAQFRSIPWPSTMKPLSVRHGYGLRDNELIWNVTWDDKTIITHEVDGTVQIVLPRSFSIWPWCDATDPVEESSPPLFPGPVNEARIAKYNWSITKRESGSIWLRGLAKAKKEKGSHAPTWEAIIRTDSWQVRAVRKLEGDREDVMAIRQD